MAQHMIDAMDDLGSWQALTPDGSPSSALLLASDTTTFRFGEDRTSMRVTVATDAFEHRAERSLADIDLRAYDEVRLWLRCDRRADGTDARPFHLEVRMASAALDFDDAENDWYRLLPVAKSDTWSLIRMSLRDMPEAVRSAVDRLRFTCIDTATTFTCHIDDLMAVRADMIADVEAALLARLHERIAIAGTDVPATIAHAADNTPRSVPKAPALWIRHCDIRPASSHITFPPTRRDFVHHGFIMYPAATGYDLDYEIDIFAEERADKAELMQFVLGALFTSSRRGELLVNGELVPIRWIHPDPGEDRAETPHPISPRLRFRVSTRRETGKPRPVVPPHQQISVEMGAL